MISMLVVCLAFKIDVLNMEQASQTKYRKGEKVFYVSPLSWKGKEEFVESYIDSWNAHWHCKNEKFEEFFLGYLVLKFLLNHIFLCWMVTTGCKPNCLTSNVCIMGIPNGITQRIPLCSTPRIALWNSSRP
jgi:hypothetical protein